MSEEAKEVVQAVEAEEEVSQTRRPKCLFDKLTVSFYSIVCFVMSILLTVVISAATIMRYILQMDLYGYEEWIKIFAFWLYFMGAAYGAFAGTHVCADLVQAYLKNKFIKNLFIFVKCVITFGVTLLFTVYAYDFFYFGFRGPLGTGVAIPKSVAWRIPQWIPYLSILIGMVSMSYYFLWDLIRAAQALFLGKEGNN